MIRRAISLLLILFVMLGTSEYNNEDESVDLDFEILTSNCSDCSYPSYYSATNEPAKINLKTLNIKEISVEGYAHIHAAIQLDNSDFVYSAVDYNGDFWILRVSDKNEITKISIRNMPDRMYAYMDTVLLHYYDGNLASLNIIDFNNNKEQILISDMANSSQFNSVFVNDNKILYKSYTENNESVWSLYENGNISTFTHDGLCVGFIEDEIVFYNKISNVFVLSDLSATYEIGKFEKYDISNNKIESLNYSIFYGTVVENFTILDNNYIIVYSYNENSGGQRHTIFNLETGKRKTLELKRGYFNAISEWK